MLLGIIIVLVCIIVGRLIVKKNRDKMTWPLTFFVGAIAWTALSLAISMQFASVTSNEKISHLESRDGVIAKFTQYNRSNEHCEFITESGVQSIQPIDGEYQGQIQYDVESGKPYLSTVVKSVDPKKISWWICWPVPKVTSTLHLPKDKKGVIVEKWRSAKPGEMIREP
ncbi:MAG: hypothetical protein WCI57_00725 [Candidatus Berkelbacteria bacterium]